MADVPTQTRSSGDRSDPASRVTAMPADTNPYGDIFGGWLLGQMDMAAGSLASRRCRGRAATVAIDAIAFHAPVKVGDEVSVYAVVALVGRSSMKIATEAWRRRRDNEDEEKVTEAIFTFVALSLDGRPRPVDAFNGQLAPIGTPKSQVDV